MEWLLNAAGDVVAGWGLIICSGVLRVSATVRPVGRFLLTDIALLDPAGRGVAAASRTAAAARTGAYCRGLILVAAVNQRWEAADTPNGALG